MRLRLNFSLMMEEMLWLIFSFRARILQNSKSTETTKYFSHKPERGIWNQFGGKNISTADLLLLRSLVSRNISKYVFVFLIAVFDNVHQIRFINNFRFDKNERNFFVDGFHRFGYVEFFTFR